MPVPAVRNLSTGQQAAKSVTSVPGGKWRLSRRAGFWAVAASFLALTAFSTAPSPLYGLYQHQDGLSSITITVVYAVYAAGVVASLLLAGHVSDWYGRRPVLIPALLTGLAAAVILTASTSLPGLLAGRVLTGLALGAAVATATAHLTDLDASPGGSASRRSQVVATVANVGGLAAGPLLAGLLGQYLPTEPALPYLIFAVLLAAATLVVAAAPEVRPALRPRPRYHPQRLRAPAGARAQFSAALTGAFLCFTVFGLFAGLGAAFLAGPLRHHSAALAGLAIFITFGCGVATQITTLTWPVHRLLRVGIPVMITGLAVLVTAAWVMPPSLALFLAGGALVGAGGGPIFRGTLTLTVSTASAGDHAGALAAFFIAGYVGLSLPVVGAGIALQYVSLKVILLAFAVVVAAGTLAASPILLGSHHKATRPSIDAGR